MIVYSPEAQRLSAQRAVASPADATPPAPVRLTRAQFIAREIAESRLVHTVATADGRGVIRWGDLRYVAMPCPVDHPLNPGWVLVRDEPGALAHYRRLFGGEQA